MDRIWLKWLATLAVSSLIMASASAYELFESEKNSARLGGYADIFVNSQDLNKSDQKESDDGQMSSGATRFSFNLEHRISDQVSLDFISEYFINLVNGDFQRSNLFVNRLGSIGFKGAQMGEVRVGKQWAPVWQLTLSYLDAPIISDCDACGIYNLTDGGLRGVGRLDKGVGYVYRLGPFGLGVQGGLSQAAEGQDVSDLQVEGGVLTLETGDAERDWNAGAAFNWVSDFGLTLGVGFTQSKLDVKSGVYYGVGEDRDVKSEVVPLVADYRYQDSLYISSSIIPYARYYHVTGYEGQGTRTSVAELVPDSYGGDIWVRYRFANTLTPYVYLSYIDMDDICQAAAGIGAEARCLQRGDSERFTAYVGLIYWPTDQVALALGYDYTNFETAVHQLVDNDRIGFKIRFWYDPDTSSW